MPDYKDALQRPVHKRFAIWLLNLGPVNRVAVALVKLAPGARWRERVPTVAPAAHCALPGGHSIALLDPSRCNVAREVFWNDGGLADKADQRALNLAIALAREATQFLDVGSYTGLFAMSVATCCRDVEVTAFEIVPDNVLLLHRNVIQNDLVGRVDVRFMGVGRAAGSIRVPRQFQPGLLPSSVALDSSTADGVAVPVRPLDEVIAARDGRIVMKIDVEGFEGEVIFGARELIAATRPDIICEFLTKAPDIAEISAILKPLGYRFYRITATGLVREEEIVPVRAERDWLLSTRSEDELARLRDEGS